MNCKPYKVKLYEKQVPGHHSQMDVKYLTISDKNKKDQKIYLYRNR